MTVANKRIHPMFALLIQFQHSSRFYVDLVIVALSHVVLELLYKTQDIVTFSIISNKELAQVYYKDMFFLHVKYHGF